MRGVVIGLAIGLMWPIVFLTEPLAGGAQTEGALRPTFSIEPRVTDDAELCNFDQITVSPNARYYIGWNSSAEQPSPFGQYSPTGHLLIGHLNCRNAEGGCNALALDSLYPLPAPAWDRSNEKLVVLNGRAATTLEIKDTGNVLQSRVENVIPLPSQIFASIKLRGQIDTAFDELTDQVYRTSKSIEDKMGARFVQRSLSFGPGGFVGAILEDRNNLEAYLLSSKSGLPNDLGLKTSQLDFIGATISANKTSATGIGYTSDADEMRPFGRVVTDSRSGQAVGTIYDDGFVPLNRSLDHAASALKGFLASNPAMFVQSASVDASTKTALFLLANLSGKKILLTATTRGFLFRSCIIRPDRLYSAIGPVGAFSVDILNIGTSEWPIWSHLYRASGDRKGLVVFMHGGPGTVSEGFAYRPTIINYLSLGYDVLVPEYSGTIGSGRAVTTRLATMGSAAIEADAKRIVEFLKEHRGSYRKTLLHAESFGGLFYFTQLAAPTVIDGAIMVTPYWRYKDPKIWLSTGGLATDSARYQRLADSGLMGIGKNDLVQWMTTKRSEGLDRGKSLFAFAQNDHISEPADRPSLKTESEAKSVVLDTFHNSSEVYDGTWKSIVSFLEPPASRL